jgi:hypothetical protein
MEVDSKDSEILSVQPMLEQLAPHLRRLAKLPGRRRVAGPLFAVASPTRVGRFHLGKLPWAASSARNPEFWRREPNSA